MTTLIILARGNSKGIRNKNLRIVAGETLLGRCIRKCRMVTQNVIVSSECDGVLAAAEANGATAKQRPAQLSEDDVSSWAVLRWMRNDMSLRGQLMHVQCTAPLMTAQDVANCRDATDCDLAVCCHPFHGYIIKDGRVINQPIPAIRRQDMSPQWLIAGSAWAFDADYLDQDCYTGRVKPVQAEVNRHLDIDTFLDLVLAEHMLAQHDYTTTHYEEPGCPVPLP